MSLLLWGDDAAKGADLDFNGPMLGLPYSLSRLGFTYTRNSPKTVYQNGALVTLSANQFGTTYDAVTGLYAFEAEPAATNLATNSAGAAATWTVSNVTDAGTPITGFAASLAFGDNGVDRTAYKSISLTTSAIYSVSVFVQMDDGLAPVVGTSTSTGDFIIVSDAATHTAAALVKSIGGSIYRVSSSQAAVTGGAGRFCGIRKAVGQSARTFRVIGIQVETGTRATSYIATAGATVTRAADVLSCATANIPGFNSAGYTLAVDWRLDVAGTGTPYLMQLDDGSASNRACLRLSPTVISSLVSSGGASSAAVGEIATGVVRNKSALSCALNSFLRAVNGVAGTADTLGAMPVGLTTLRIGCSESSISQLNGYIFGLKLIPVALNQAQTNGQT